MLAFFSLLDDSKNNVTENHDMVERFLSEWQGAWGLFCHHW